MFCVLRMPVELREQNMFCGRISPRGWPTHMFRGGIPTRSKAFLGSLRLPYLSQRDNCLKMCCAMEEA